MTDTKTCRFCGAVVQRRAGPGRPAEVCYQRDCRRAYERARTRERHGEPQTVYSRIIERVPSAVDPGAVIEKLECGHWHLGRAKNARDMANRRRFCGLCTVALPASGNASQQ
jgi:hypothetical protein